MATAYHACLNCTGAGHASTVDDLVVLVFPAQLVCGMVSQAWGGQVQRVSARQPVGRLRFIETDMNANSCARLAA